MGRTRQFRAGKNDWLRMVNALLFNSRSSFYVPSTVLDLADILYIWLRETVTPTERPMTVFMLLLSHQWSDAN